MCETVVDGPAYKFVADDLRAQIRSGKLAAGARLPSLAQLADRYGVGTDAGRRAINELRAEGLVETSQGKGAFVRKFARIPRRSPGRLSKTQWGRGKAIQDHDTGPRWRAVDVVVSETPAGGDVAQGLDVDNGTPVLSRARRFLVDDRPVQLATSYYPLDIARGTAISYTDTGPGGVYARLAEVGFAPTHFTESLTARAPHTDEAFELAMAKTGGIVFDVTRWAYTEEGRCVEVNRMVLDAAAFELTYDFTAG